MTNVTISNLLSATEKKAWTDNIYPKLTTYFATIMPVYRAASDEKKAELRAHNSLLNALATLWES